MVESSLQMGAESTGLAQVSFRVRCEKIGYGESVFLSQADNTAAGNRIPLFTTAKSFPWYTTRTPLALALSATPSSDATDANVHYRYRYAIYRAGIFLHGRSPLMGVTSKNSTPIMLMHS